MTRLARRRGRRVFGAGGTALLLGAGVLVGLTVAGGAPRAAADAGGTVYAASLGGVSSVGINAARVGGGSPSAVSGLPANASANPIAVNKTANLALAGFTTTQSTTGLAVVDVASGSVLRERASPSTPPGSEFTYEPIGIAMDPTNSGVAWAVFSPGAGPQSGAVQVDRVNLNNLALTNFTPNGLPAAPRGEIAVPSSVVITPDGQTLLVGWGSTNFNAGGFFGIDSIPLNHGPGPTITEWFRGGSSVGSQTVDPSSDDFNSFPTVTHLAMAPDGGGLFASAISADDFGHTGAVFAVGLPLQATTATSWFDLLPVVGPLALPMTLATNGGGTALYVGGVGLQNPTLVARIPSVVQAFSTTTGSRGPSAVIPVDATLDPSGVDAVAVSPDNATVLALALDPVGNQTSLYAVAASNLAVLGSTRVTGQTPPNNFSNLYGPEDLAVIPPAPGPPPPTTTPTTIPTTPTTAHSTTSTPTTTGTNNTTNTTTPSPGSTTTTTVKGHQAPGTPTLILNPAVGSPGTIVTVTGHGFRPNKPVTVSWTVSTGSVVITADAHGNLPPRTLLILTPDVLGQRYARASSNPPATAPFLVVPSTSEPGGDNAGLLFRSEGP
jgi:hypothetical protein